MTHEAIWAQAIAHIAHNPRVLGYLAEWYRMYRKSGPCVPKVRLRVNQMDRISGSLSLSHRETSMSLLYRRITARARSFARRLPSPFMTPNDRVERRERAARWPHSRPLERVVGGHVAITLRTAPFVELHGRTFDAPKRTEHTAIARHRPKQFATPFALVEEDARVGGQFFRCGGSAFGAGDDGAQCYFHGDSNDV